MGMIKDPTSWRVGFELGLAGFSFPYSKPRKPTAYLYNGIRLPALPEWDREKYPKAMIHPWSKDEIRLIVFSDVDDVYAESSWWIEVNINAPWLGWTYDAETNTWGQMTDNGEYELYEIMVAGENMNLAIWSNFDVFVTTSHGDYFPVGMLAFAASEPVPVYE